MISEALVLRINQLAQKQREGTLNEAERLEQKQLREQYLAGIRKQIVTAFDSMGLKPKQDACSPKKPHAHSCSCHHCHSEQEKQ